MISRSWDDQSRTVTTRDEQGTPTTRPYTVDENQQADAAIAGQALLTDLAARLARIEAHLWPADPDPEPGVPITAPSWEDYDGVWPHGKLLSDGGKTWRNVSGVPLTTKPTAFPGAPNQWAHLFVEAVSTPDPEPDPDPEPGDRAWEVGLTVTVGEIVTHTGHRWSAVVAHTTHAGWIPGPATWSVWTDLGTI